MTPAEPVEQAAVSLTVEEVLAAHQRIITAPYDACWCGKWPVDGQDQETWMHHVAAALRDAGALRDHRRAHRGRAIKLTAAWLLRILAGYAAGAALGHLLSIPTARSISAEQAHQGHPEARS